MVLLSLLLLKSLARVVPPISSYCRPSARQRASQFSSSVAPLQIVRLLFPVEGEDKGGDRGVKSGMGALSVQRNQGRDRMGIPRPGVQVG